MANEKVLITGGSGLVGTRLTDLLLNKGYRVAHLSRSPDRIQLDGVKSYKWDTAANYLDKDAIKGTNYIIHLAGAGVADKPWTKSRKELILNSRTDTADLLYNTLKETDHQVKAFISASAIGYYGDRGNELVTEESARGKGFLSDVCVAWEDSAFQIKDLGIRTAAIRIGIVLAKEGGALKEIARPVKFGVGAYLGDGKQYYSWVHIDDLCRIFIQALEQEDMVGIYNGVAPTPETNRHLTEMVAKAMGKFNIPAPAPEFVLKLAMGEMSEVVLNSQKVSAEKILSTGFKFQHPQLLPALKEIYS